MTMADPTSNATGKNLRVLVVDDNRAIHDDFRKILAADSGQSELDALEAAIFGGEKSVASRATFELSFASQGAEALEMVKAACAEDRRYAVVFMDVRMPPGWDGIETTVKVWEVDPDLQVVICTAYSDYSWEEMMGMVGNSDQLLILKKPFDTIEVLQFAHALCDKWSLLQASRQNAEALETAVRARTSELELANRRLEKEIAERQQLLAELAAARDEALQSVRLKGQFLANMSHEIRTPMNGVVGMVELLLQTELNREQRDYAETIRSSADLLLDIINDILDFSKIEAGKLTFESIDFDLHEVIGNTLDVIAPRARSKSLELACCVQPDVFTKLRGDSGRLSQVLTNILGNAIKFTERGEVVVMVARVAENGGDTMLRFEVRDTGIGISPEARERIFEPFSQADGTTTRKYGGSGLGLSISRQIVTGLGGVMGVESTVGVGSTFWFTARFEKQPDAPSPRELYPVCPTTARVLVVDDSPTNREILRLQLGNWNVRCSTAASGPEGLELMREARLARDPFAIAILDMQMPGMDGLTMAREIQADERLAGTRLLVLSSIGDLIDPRDLEEAGISEYLVKPVKQARLYETLAVILNKSSGPASAAAPATPVRRGLADEARAKVRILIAEDNSVNQKVALLQLARLGYNADLAADGLEVLDKLRETPYDIILMDCQMPELDGYAATRRIRREFDRPIRIIAMTANAMPGEREKCLAAGMDDYVSKPVRTEDLERALEAWTPAAASKPAPSPAAAAGSPAEMVAAPVNLERLLDVVGGQSEILPRIVRDYLAQAEEIVLAIAQAIAQGAARDVHCLAHKLVGSSASCGITAVLDPLRQLEQLAAGGSLQGATELQTEAGRQLEIVRRFLDAKLPAIAG